MKKFFGVLLTVIIILPLILSSLVIYPLSTLVLDRDFYIDTFSSEEIQSVILSDENIEAMLTESLSEVEDIDPSALMSLFRTLISEQFYKNQVSAIVNQVFDFLEGNKDTLTPQIDLGEIKDEFNGPNQQVLLEELAKGIPVCLDALPTQDLEFTLCKPAAMSDEEFIEDFLKPSLPLLLALIPNKVTASEPIRRSELLQGIPSFFHPYLTISGLKTLILILAAITVLFWFLIGFLAGDNGKERLLWLGWTLFIPSILILVSSFVLKQNFIWNLLEYSIGQHGFLDLSDLFSTTGISLQSLYFLFAEKISSMLTLISGIAASIGLGLIAWGAVQSKNN